MQFRNSAEKQIRKEKKRQIRFGLLTLV